MTEKNEADKLFNDFWKWRLRQTPEFASLIGNKDYDDELEEFTSVRFARDLESCQEFNDRAEQLLHDDSAHLSVDDQLNLRLFQAELGTFINGYPFKGFLFPINFMEGVHVDFERISGWVSLDSVQDFEKLLARYEKFAEQAKGIVGVLQEGVDQKYTNHAVSMQGVLDIFKGHLDKNPSETVFYEPFKKLPESIPRDEANALMERAENAIASSIQPGMSLIKSFLEEIYLEKTRPNIAITSLYNGEAFYQECIRFHTSTSLTAKQIHEIGLAEVESIETEMKLIAVELGYDMPLKDFMEKLRSDPNNYHKSPEELLAGFKTIVEEEIQPKLKDIFSKEPEHSLEITVCPNANYPAAFYICGTSDGSRPGKFFANTFKFDSQPKYEMMSLALHEGNPGHHLQGSFQIGQKDMPMFRTVMEDRSYFMSPSRFPINTAYIEGWALYAESLGHDMGLYKDPYVRFGYLSNNIFRACRLVVDTGMHAFNWTQEQAVQFMLDHSASSRGEIESEVRRYITWPGQALGYKIGEIKIKELRRECESRLGEDKFDIKEFHDVVLRAAGPLDVVEEEVRMYIKNKM